MSAAYIVMTILGIIIGILLIAIFRLQKSGFNHLANRMADKDRSKLEILKPCPVCGSMLRKGERVHSVYYRNTKAKGHQLPVEEIHTEIYGCPYCWPANDSAPRICPVCSKTVSADGYIVARTFRKPERKDHVHVIGCTECKRVR